MAYPQAGIGVIGGTGLYAMADLKDVQEVRVQTPFGSPSDTLVVGTLSGQRVAFLPRHGRGHRIAPSQMPARANIFALKLLGVKRIISVSAVGSLKEEIRPLDMVVPDQIIDRTRGRPNTFFDESPVVHIAFADPFCSQLIDLLVEEVQSVGVKVHRGGVYVAMEGPQFSTRAESNMYRSWGASVIGMTALPEAKLAREAEMCYAVLACSTDYDSWREGHDSVTAEMIIANLLKNVDQAKSILRSAVAHMPDKPCSCQSALATAIVTAPALVSQKVRVDLAPILGKYFHGK